MMTIPLPLPIVADHSSGGEHSLTDSSMTQVLRHAIVRRSDRQMFDLVNDVDAYPQRFPWCESAQVVDRGEVEITAELCVRLGSLRTAFTTRNRLFAPGRIELSLVDGPFRSLSGAWRFHALGLSACRVELHLDFEPAGRLMGSALAMGFTALADRLVDDFCREARKLPEPADA